MSSRQAVEAESAAIRAELDASFAHDVAEADRLKQVARDAEAAATRKRKIADMTHSPWAIFKHIGAWMDTGMAEVTRLRTDHEVGKIERRRQRKESGAQRLETNIDGHVASRTREARELLEIAREGVESPEFRGAIAEELVIAALSELPDDWYVLNDMTVRLDRGLRWNGKWRQQAQIDHVVVGPSGVHIVETKNWSQNFVDSGHFRCPFDQVALASHLIRCFLKNRGLQVRVESMIATIGALPTKPADSYAALLRPHMLCGYLLKRKQRIGPEEARRIARVLGPELG